MSDPVPMIGSIVGAGLELGALGMTLNFVNEMSHSQFTGNKKRQKHGGGINDQDLMFGFGGGMGEGMHEGMGHKDLSMDYGMGHKKSKGKKHDGILDFGDYEL